MKALAPSFSLSGLRASFNKSIGLTSDVVTSFNKVDDIQSSLKSAVWSRGGALWKATVKRYDAAQAKATAGGKRVNPKDVVTVKLLEDVENIELNAKRTEAEIANEAAPGKDAKAGEAGEAAPPAQQGKEAKAGKEAKDKKEKRLKYAKVVGVLLAVAVAATTTGLVMKAYEDRAKEEREQCLARWETKYLSIIKDENGELLEIDSAEKWSDNLLYLEKVIESREEVNGDPEKANDLLVEMYNDLVECISMDTSPFSAFLEGITRDVGNALGNLVDPVAAPLNKIIDSSADLFKYIGIAVGAVVVLAIIIALIFKARSNQNQIHPLQMAKARWNRRRSNRVHPNNDFRAIRGNKN